MNKFEIETITKKIDKEIIKHEDYMYPIFKAISHEITNNWNENGIDSWNHYDLGKLYKLTLRGQNTWINLEYPDGIKIDISEDGILQSSQYNPGPTLYLNIPKNWNFFSIQIDDKFIKLQRKKEE